MKEQCDAESGNVPSALTSHPSPLTPQLLVSYPRENDMGEHAVLDLELATCFFFPSFLPLDVFIASQQYLQVALESSLACSAPLGCACFQLSQWNRAMVYSIDAVTYCLQRPLSKGTSFLLMAMQTPPDSHAVQCVCSQPLELLPHTFLDYHSQQTQQNHFLLCFNYYYFSLSPLLEFCICLLAFDTGSSRHVTHSQPSLHTKVPVA